LEKKSKRKRLQIYLVTGLERGLAGEPCEFTIVTKDAGPGGLALAVHGPSKAEITCTDNGDGTCTVQYVPDEPGKLWLSSIIINSSGCVLVSPVHLNVSFFFSFQLVTH